MKKKALKIAAALLLLFGLVFDTVSVQAVSMKSKVGIELTEEPARTGGGKQLPSTGEILGNAWLWFGIGLLIVVLILLVLRKRRSR